MSAMRAGASDPGAGGEEKQFWGGGELGPGIYLTTSRSAAWLYGAAIAQHKGEDKVVLWGVDYDAAADWVEPTPVPNSSQYERFPPSLWRWS